MNQFYKNLALWLVISLVMIMLFNMMTQQGRELKPVPYTTFLAALDEGEVVDVTIKGSNLEGTYTDGSAFKTYVPDDPELISLLREQGVAIQAEPDESNSFWMSILVSWGPILLLIAVWIFFMRQMQSGGGKAMSFGKSRAKLLSESQAKITFNDVAGIDEAKDELEEVVSFLKDPKKFSRLGGRIPKGVLLVGPPGTGKTLLGRAIAGEAGVPFFSISGSDFVEMFVGVGASRVRDLFVQGKKNAPCIIFIDEIDAVGRHRGAGMGGGHDEREQTLNQLLVEMDGFESNEGVILIAATNRPDVLDPALLRPGRFDRQVVVPRPDVRGRLKILQVHARKVPLGNDVELEVIAKGTPGFSGADIKNLVNEAAMLAARDKEAKVMMRHFDDARDKLLLGTVRTLAIQPEERHRLAVHESGHALVAYYLPHADPIYKVSIIPRGRALGVTHQLPEYERHTLPEEYLLDRLAVMLGGRCAEQELLGTISSGADDDIAQATALARAMVSRWGMSSEIGPVDLRDSEEHPFLGREIAQPRRFSENSAQAVDNAVKQLLKDAEDRALELIRQQRPQLDSLIQTLEQNETLGREQVKSCLEGLSVTTIEQSGTKKDSG